MCLPYLGPQSHTLARKLSQVVNTNYSTVQFNPVFTTAKRLGSFFQYKDKMPDPLRSSVIYKYSCGNCNATYIGKTLRNLSIRTDEHKGISFRTKLRLSKPMLSAIREHAEQYDHLIQTNNFTILDHARNDYELCILESLWIWKLRPTLNEHNSSVNIEFTK